MTYIIRLKTPAAIVGFNRFETRFFVKCSVLIRISKTKKAYGTLHFAKSCMP